MAQAEELKMTLMLQAGQTYSQWTSLKTEIGHNDESCVAIIREKFCSSYIAPDLKARCHGHQEESRRL